MEVDSLSVGQSDFQTALTIQARGHHHSPNYLRRPHTYCQDDSILDDIVGFDQWSSHADLLYHHQSMKSDVKNSLDPLSGGYISTVTIQ